ncbi:MAG: hypothetical protein NT080_03690 [Spirochaetes bacterium]|nr:hypothetical protein [Spirochaetota bacterium]
MRSGGFHAKNGASVWKDLEFVLSPSDEERKRAAGLVEEVEAGLPVERTQSSLLRMSDPSAAAFFSILADRRSRESRCELETGSSWMLRADFCFVNVRATGIDGRPGDFIAASKLLPGITASAVHLAPFHPYQFEVLYAIEDPYEIAEELVNIELASAGIGPLAQLRAFMEACRLLDKVIGYDLTPHVAQYSRVVLDSPEAFAWIKLAPDRNSVLEGGHPYERIARIGTAREAAGVIARVKGKTGFERFSREAAGPVEATNASGKPIGQELKERSLATRAYYEAIRDLIAEGLWPVPTQAWDGIGLPEFARYDREGNYPVFLYRNERGDDVSSHSYGVVTPYAFYDNIPPNKAPDPGKLPELARSPGFRFRPFRLGRSCLRLDARLGWYPACHRPSDPAHSRPGDRRGTDGRPRRHRRLRRADRHGVRGLFRNRVRSRTRRRHAQANRPPTPRRRLRAPRPPGVSQCRGVTEGREKGVRLLRGGHP